MYFFTNSTHFHVDSIEKYKLATFYLTPILSMCSKKGKGFFLLSKLVHHHLFFHDFQWAFATLYACFMTSPFRVNCSELNSIWTCNVNSKMNSHSAHWRSWFYSKIKSFSHSVFISELFIAMLQWHFFCIFIFSFLENSVYTMKGGGMYTINDL